MDAPQVVGGRRRRADRAAGRETDQRIRDRRAISCMTMNIGAEAGSMPASCRQSAGDRYGRLASWSRT